jgi:hypothetical protein
MLPFAENISNGSNMKKCYVNVLPLDVPQSVHLSKTNTHMGASTYHQVTFMTKYVYGKNHHIMIDYDGNRGNYKKMKNK